MNNIIFPNIPAGGDGRFRLQSDWDAIQALHVQKLERLTAAANVPEGDWKNRQFTLEAFARAEGIKVFGDLIPPQDEIQQARKIDKFNSTLHQQMQVSLLAFKAGVAVAADLHEIGYDTHDRHDEITIPLIANFSDAIDYLWTTAEELDLADRLVVLIGSDFGRTPFFNGSQGKDHWPIGSYIVMGKNAGYTNQVIGETDGGHNALRINPVTLQRDDSQGMLLHPGHVHKALRRYLGIENDPITQLFPFNNTSDFNFFG